MTKNRHQSPMGPSLRPTSVSRVGLLGCFLWAVSGCVSVDDLWYGRDSYEQNVRKEAASLITSYRKCLQKYEGSPQQARANCSTYLTAIQELAPPSHKRSIGDFVDWVVHGD